MGSHPSGSVPELDAPKTGWAYFDTTDKKIYLHDETQWNPMLDLQSADVAGLTIVFKGNHAGHTGDSSIPGIDDPRNGWVYFNTTDGKTYLYNGDTGTVPGNGRWEAIAAGAQTCEVVFDTGVGSAVPRQIVIAQGRATRPADPFRSGKIFAGWYTDDGTWLNPWSFETAVDEDTQLYAAWAEAASPYDREDFGTASPSYPAPAGVNSAQTWAAAINAITASGNYVIDITGSFTLLAAGTASNPNIGPSGAVVSVRGHGDARIALAAAEQGNLLNVAGGIKVILRDVTLAGSAANNTALVSVDGELIMRDGAAAAGNGGSSYAHGVLLSGTGAKLAMEGNARIHNNSGSGVRIEGSNPQFTMGGSARIYGNLGGVLMDAVGAVFTMSGSAQIHGNLGPMAGGGVCMIGGTFTMGGNAKIYGNSAGQGGGVAVTNGGVVYMGGNAQIYGNSAQGVGGGVELQGTSEFYMSDNAQIYGNSAVNRGGGVNIESYSGAPKFMMTGGVVYGANAPLGFSNTADSGGGNALSDYSGNGIKQWGHFKPDSYSDGFQIDDFQVDGNFSTPENNTLRYSDLVLTLP